MNVMDVDWLVDCLPTEVIRCAVGKSLLDTATGQPHRESVGIVIAAVVGLAAVESAAHLDYRGAAELGAGNDDRVIE